MTELVGQTAAQALTGLPPGASRVGHTLIAECPDGGRREAQLGLDGTVRGVHDFPAAVVAALGAEALGFHVPDAVLLALRRFSGGTPAPAAEALPAVLTAGGVRAVPLWTRFDADGGQLRAYTLVEGGLVLLRLDVAGRLAGVGMQNGLLGLTELDREDRTRERLAERHDTPLQAQTLGEALAHTRATGAGVLALRLEHTDPHRVSLVCETPVDRRAPWVPHLGGEGRPEGTETRRALATYTLTDPWRVDPADLGPVAPSLLNPVALSVLASSLVHPGRPTPPSPLDRRIARAALDALLARIPAGAAALPEDAFTSKLAPLRRRQHPDHFTRAGLETLIAGLAPAPAAGEPPPLIPQARQALTAAMVPGRPLMAAVQAGVEGALLVASPLAQLQTEPDRWRRFFVITGTGTPVATAVLAVDTDDQDSILDHVLLEGGAAQAQLAALAPALQGPDRSRQAALVSAAALAESLGAQLRAGLGDPAALAGSLRPRPGDAAKVFRADVAGAIDAAQSQSWDAGRVRIRPQSDQTALQVSVCPAGLLAQGGPLARPFPGAYRALAEYLEPSRTWATWVHHAPGKTKGLRYDGLVWVDDHWAWFPKPWRALPSR